MTNDSLVGIQAFKSSVDVYVRVDPTGFLVKPLDTQLSQITLGSNQSLTFTPSLYSLDLDTSTVASDSVYNFSCTLVDNGLEQDYPKLYENVYLDLASFKVNGYSNEPCFTSSGWILLFFF